MADRSSVVSKFSAELLWNEGYRGELVKMGVFDTGIRLDHPHVKHIRWAARMEHLNRRDRHTRPSEIGNAPVKLELHPPCSLTGGMSL